MKYIAKLMLWDRNKDGNYRGWQFSRYVTQISRLKLKMVTTGKLQRKLREFHANKVGNVRRLKGQQSAQSGLFHIEQVKVT